MRAVAPSSERHNVLLLEAAQRGDDQAIIRILNQSAFWQSQHLGNALTACLTGEGWLSSNPLPESRLNILRYLIEHPDLSVATINAPQSSFHGVPPLCIAAWLGSADACQILLESDKVYVDIPDLSGATALLYAARDGISTVIEVLLAYNPRPDARDANNGTPIYHSLYQPEALTMLESALAQYRWLRYWGKNEEQLHIPHLMDTSGAFAGARCRPTIQSDFKVALTKGTEMVVQAVQTTDVKTLQSLLFPGRQEKPIPDDCIVTVNRRCALGWAPLHHCAMAQVPSLQILDLLYLAGVDTALCARRSVRYTALHCLASATYEVDPPEGSLYAFALHFIRDLGAPLAARDIEGETPMHIAAEHGQFVDVLRACIDCDNDGVVQKCINHRGLTPFEVAKPQFKAAFSDSFLAPLRSRTSASSIQTVISSGFDVASQASTSACTTPGSFKLSGRNGEAVSVEDQLQKASFEATTALSISAEIQH